MRRTIPILSAATAALALVTVASCTTTAGADDTPAPEATPAAHIAAERGPECGTVRMDYVTASAPFEIYRVVTKEPTQGEDVQDWIRQPRDPISRIDSIIPSGYSVTYRLQLLGVDQDFYSEPVVTEQCPEPTPDPTQAPSTPSTSPAPSPSPSSSLAPEPSASAGSAAPSSPAPETKDSEGGLAATGVDRTVQQLHAIGGEL